MSALGQKRTYSKHFKMAGSGFLHCETEDGDVMLRMTGEAVHELKALLEKLPLKIGKRKA